MTLNGAIMELVMLSEHPIMPVIFKPSIQKIIETVSECEEPKRKTGRWIYQDDRREVTGNDWYCSECGNGIRYQDHYCPNCGAKMEVEHE